ncbi:hypothetical protein IQ37_08235 [Chryseobacterium piperi]|uniref:Uncharacterized protein n=2 Tax=Chryseobacterium piperi TaxID=558152 RepID=A0A086BJ43_9FLAO|nr:outer membrane beta-barrel protein [Chryseobacterium piperi]ASW75921.1 hypothetical protein CJF12_17695 [Chryseobacterium piperi]KFF28957.1 hypothetical protein IQ37_08235 [Chryseobacterium piperi]
MIKKITLLGMFSISIMSLAQQKFSIIPSVGYAWRTGKTPANLSREVSNHVKGLKSGLNFDISAYYHLKGNTALGLKYSHFTASSNSDFRVRNDNGQTFYVNLNTRDNISFVGPSFMYSNFNDESRHKLYFDIALGVISYSSNTNGMKITGSNLGMDTNVGYQYAITKNFSIGPKFGFTAGTLSRVKMNGTSMDLGDNQKESLHRVSLSAAAAFRF